MDSFAKTFQKLASGHSEQSRVIPLPYEASTAAPHGTARLIDANESYFELRLNQMSLIKNQLWLNQYDPLVVFTVGFIHKAEEVEIPVILGPGTIQKHFASGAPKYGTVLSDLRIIGPYPYLGHGLTMSVNFYRIQRQDMVKSLLKVVEQLSSLVGFDQVGTMIKAGGMVLDGLKEVLGADGTDCLAEHRFNLPRQTTVPFESGSWALVLPPTPPKEGTLHLSDGRLFEQNKNGSAPYEASDFLVFSVEGIERRQNIQISAANGLREQALKAAREGKDSRQRAKALLLSALQQLGLDGDFTQREAGILFDEWIGEFKRTAENYDQAHAMPVQQKTPKLSNEVRTLNSAAAQLDL